MERQEAELVKDILLDTHKDVAVIKTDISAIKADLKEHIRRTNIVETEVKWLHKQVYFVHGAIALVGLVATVLAIISRLQG